MSRSSEHEARACRAFCLVEMLDSASGAVISDTLVELGVVGARSSRIGSAGEWTFTLQVEWPCEAWFEGRGSDPHAALDAAVSSLAAYHRRMAKLMVSSVGVRGAA